MSAPKLEQTEIPDLPALAELPEEESETRQVSDALRQAVSDDMTRRDEADIQSAALVPVKLPEWGVGTSWLAEFERMAVRLGKATVLPDALRGSPQNILAVALAGRELGLGFMEATRQIHIIKGQTSLSAELKLALAKRSGLVIDSVDESNGCKITAHRSDTGEVGIGEFTEADRVAAKIGNEADSAWKKYPRDMYWARAATRLMRRLCPDAKGASFRSVEEISDEVTPDA